jgi:ribosomal protein S18 acetylase RimI-like enzyme
VHGFDAAFRTAARRWSQEGIRSLPALPTIEELLTRERAYYEVLSRCEKRWWGLMWLDPNNPDSPHSNHAYLDARLGPDQLPAVLNEVARCYSVSGLEPLLRFHIPPQGQELVQIAEDRGWETEAHEEIWRAWPTETGWQQPWAVGGMTLAMVGPEALNELLAVPKEDADPRTAIARARRWAALVENRDTDCMLARIDGEPAAVLACIWSDGWGCIEGVRTRARFRGRGVCTAMMRTMQHLAAERSAAGLFLYTEMQAADRIYARIGFQPVGWLRRASARRYASC